MLDELFKRFTREKLLLENVSPRTVQFYQQCFKAFKATMEDELPDRFICALQTLKMKTSLLGGCGWCHCHEWDRATRGRIRFIRSRCVLCGFEIEGRIDSHKRLPI